jgi:lycopene cyclase domain-containing protein
MSESVSRRIVTSRRSDHIVLLMLLMVVIPAAITLHTVRVPAVRHDFSSNPTPLGYTWSLLLFIVPIVVIAGWFLPQEGVEIPQKAFWRTIAILIPCGAGLDFFFAHRFFCFPNPGATLGIAAPALGKPVPIEEYVFYLTGFITVLLIYVWADEFWFAAYNVGDYPGESRKIPRLLQFHGASVGLGLVLIAAAIVYKKVLSPTPEGFPGYFTFLVATALVPAAAFFPSARPFINWRAFSLTLFIVVLISLIWEATLALPYGWWGFQKNQMIGLSIGAWYGLPIEEVGVWIAVSYATAIVFEIVKLWQASGKKATRAFLGTKETSLVAVEEKIVPSKP